MLLHSHMRLTIALLDCDVTGGASPVIHRQMLIDDGDTRFGVQSTLVRDIGQTMQRCALGLE
jgi:hypothetical protein